MKIYAHTIRKSQQEIDESRFNQRFPIYAQLQVISLSSVATGKEIPNKRYLNELYHRYQMALFEGDKAKERKLVVALKREIIQLDYINKAFEEKFKKVNTEENIRSDVWTIDSVGIVAHEDID
jgi:hypothetical protein